eukprot:687646-Alexandrium_andersonii.AAC.1
MGGRGPSPPNGPNGPLRGSESPEIRSPPIADLGAGGAARSATPALESARSRCKLLAALLYVECYTLGAGRVAQFRLRTLGAMLDLRQGCRLGRCDSG